jgi:hypothetical protein
VLRGGSPSRDGDLASSRTRWTRAQPFASEALLITLAILAYFGIRNATAGSPAAAFANADRIVALEERLGIDWEDELQALVIDHGLLVNAVNWVYIWLHWPVILTAAVALFLVRRDRYVLLRNALFVSGAIGFLFYALLPVAPPRLHDLGLVDTVTENSYAYRALQPPGLTNQYAAFPSLHAGWNLLVGVVLVLAFTGLGIRAFAIAMPAAMGLAVVMTANHFVVDVVAGIAVVSIGLAVALAIQLRRPAPRDVGGEADLGDGSADRVPEQAVARAPRAP